MQCILIYKKEKKEEMAAKEPKGELAFDINQMMNAPTGESFFPKIFKFPFKDPFGSVHTI
jgi:hypothetical protein